MIELLKDIILEKNKNKNNISDQSLSELKKIQVATCALFLEVANSDENFSDDEKDKILEIMQNTFGLDQAEVKQLVSLSEEHVQRSISLYEFTDIVNKNFSQEEKLNVLKNLWRLVFVDNHLHQYEDYYLRKISGNLMMPHSDFINTKIEIKNELGIN